jgi:hypothetical protein
MIICAGLSSTNQPTGEKKKEDLKYSISRVEIQ